MKTNLFKTKVLVWMLLIQSFFSNYTFGQTYTTVEFTPSSTEETWNVPIGAEIDVEVWGKGGDGLSNGGSGGGDGGGGGGYAIIKGVKNITSVKIKKLVDNHTQVVLIGTSSIGTLMGISTNTIDGGSFYFDVVDLVYSSKSGINGANGTLGTGSGGSGGKGAGPDGGAGGTPTSPNGEAPGGGGAGKPSMPMTLPGSGGSGMVLISFTIPIPPSITTTFNQVAPICKGATLAALPTTSTNLPTGITGTWAPAINNLATTTYTFTPAPGQDASTATMTILVVAPPVPTATSPQAFCPGQKVADLTATPLTNSIVLKWYSTLTGGSELPPTYELTATTYFVSQYDGACESDRTPVVVNFNPVPSVTASITTAATACNIGSITITPSRTTDDTILIDETFNATNSNWSIYKDAYHETGGQNFVKLTKDENSKNGQLLFAKTSASPKAFEMSFQAFMQNKSGADGFSVNYGEIGNVQSLQEDGNGTGLVLRFKTYNQDRIQLVYNNVQYGGDNSLTLEDGNWWTYTISVTESGQISLKRKRLDNTGSENIIFNAQLPNSYTTTANYQWAFAGRTGGEKNEHIIDAVKFTDKTPLQFSYDQTNWQLATTFTNVPAGSRTVYARRGNAGCAKSLGTINVVGTPSPTPTFTLIAPICKGASLSPLPTTSTNNYAGTWAPALDNMATTTYTFTPSAGVCANTATMTIVVNEPVTPTFSGNTVVLDKKNSDVANYSPFVVTTAATYRIELWGKGGESYSPTLGGGGGGYTGIETLLTQGNYTTGFFSLSSLNFTYFNSPGGGAKISAENGVSSPVLSLTANNGGNNTGINKGGTATGGTKNINGGNGANSQGGGGASGWWGHNGASLDGTSTAGGDSGTPDNSSDGGDYQASGKFPGGGTGASGGSGSEGRILITKIAPLITTYCKGAIITPLPTTSVEGITGTWAPTLDNMNSTTYTFTPTAGQCANTATLTITVNDPTTVPTFVEVAPICNGATLAALPTTSTNNVKGTWAPVMNNQTTTTYTFTPSAGECASTATMEIVVNDIPATPTANSQTLCTGSTVADLVATGTNLKWYYNANDITPINPSVILGSAQLFYHVSQTVNGCESSKLFVSVTVSPKATPTFTQVGPICKGSTIAALPTTSTNNITGTWDPTVMDNQTTTTYTFTPTAGLCANSTTMQIVVKEPVVPTFTQIAPICKGEAFIGIPTNSTNNIDGTWSPSFNDQTTTTYTFTPDADECASGTASMTIVVKAAVPLPVVPSGQNGFLVSAEGNTIGTCPDYRGIYAFPQVFGPNVIYGNQSISAFSLVLNGGLWSIFMNDGSGNQQIFTNPMPGPVPPVSGWVRSPIFACTDNSITIATIKSLSFCEGATVFDLKTAFDNGINVKFYDGSNAPIYTSNNTVLTSGNVFVTQTIDGCESEKLQIQITVKTKRTPTFSQLGPICKGANMQLPPSSNENIPGGWSPSFDNQASGTYTFTPSSGQCANTATMTIVVNNCSVISGTVLEDADGGNMDGTPLTVSGAYLSIYPATITNNVTSLGVPPTPQLLHVVPITMVTGAYTFPALPDGRYKIVIGTSATGSETPSFPNVGNFSMTYSAEGEAGTAGDGTPDGITYVTISAGAPIYDGGSSRVRADAGISFAIKQLAPLPIRLISFSGKNTKKGNELNWKASSEVNFSHFEVERSNDVKKFEKIGKVEGNKGENYEFIDQKLQTTNQAKFYRLKMVDLDGSFAFSKIIVLNTENIENSIGQIYPNPTIREANIIVNVKESCTWTIKTFDITGKLISNEITNLIEGENKIELKKLGTGMNYIQMTNGKIKEVRKVLKQ